MANPAIRCRHNNQGFILVSVMWLLLLLVFLGIGAINKSNVELLIAGNDKFQTTAFHEAEGGIATGTQLLEENINCPGGFTANSGSDRSLNGSILGGSILVLGFDPDNPTPNTLNFWQNIVPGADAAGRMIADRDPESNPEPAAYRDIYFPHNYENTGSPHTNLRIGGQTFMGAGGSLQQAAGYEGKGKNIAGGGGFILYDIYAQHMGEANSESIIHVQWRHAIGQEGSCNDDTL